MEAVMVPLILYLLTQHKDIVSFAGCCKRLLVFEGYRTSRAQALGLSAHRSVWPRHGAFYYHSSTMNFITPPKNA